MTMYNFKYYSKLVLYYVLYYVRGLCLLLLAPVATVSTILVDALSGWEPSKPLHTSEQVDEYTNPDNLGI